MRLKWLSKKQVLAELRDVREHLRELDVTLPSGTQDPRGEAAAGRRLREEAKRVAPSV